MPPLKQDCGGAYEFQLFRFCRPVLLLLLFFGGMVLYIDCGSVTCLAVAGFAVAIFVFAYPRFLLTIGFFFLSGTLVSFPRRCSRGPTT